MHKRSSFRLRQRSAAFLLALTSIMVFSSVALADSIYLPGLFGQTNSIDSRRADAAGPKPRFFEVDLQPLNNSGVSGTAHLILTQESLVVHIEANGLESDKTHAQHIHGLPDENNSTCPPPTADTDGDGIVSVVEGLPHYGPVLLGLNPFTNAPGGVIEFTNDYTDLGSLEPVNTLQNRAIVIHGLTIGGTYVGSTPVACGQIRRVPKGQNE